ncbi:eCIS core domain-containing protein [Pelomonas sp. BJYL3]|uniref:eCIS core domain-containing protein n=1 Tax=Pelomonas sp. BJYL3 TaxID=2976697 RepID=UPI0022B3EB85|nr:DUF4157 domain-containing protein [Pelomonas sp. BJYL3]
MRRFTHTTEQSLAQRQAQRPAAEGSEWPAQRAARSPASGSTRQRQQDDRLAQLRASPEGALPQDLTQGIAALSGIDLSGVRVHRNSARPAALQAHAYAQGNEIHLGPGQERHLPHEAWHLVQQAQGRVQATAQMQGGVALNDSPALEREADRMGARAQAAAGQPVQRLRHGPDVESRAAPLQRVGRGGHIGIGAAIGSIIPVLGTAIGGLIGNHIYNKKQRRQARGQRGGAADPAAAAHLPALQQLIQNVRADIQAGNHQAAANALSDRRSAVLGSLGLRLDLQLSNATAADMVDTVAERNMYFPVDRRIRIVMPATFADHLATFWTDDAALSRKILFMALEEYMHAYQNLSSSFFSPSTSEYKGTDRAQQAVTAAGGPAAYDFDEIDVMAAYHDWGEDVQALDYVNRYQERQDFHQWQQDRQTRGYRFKDALALN